MAPKKIPIPAWYKNTYFWIAGILFILFIVGLIGGDPTIRDPGQKREGMLWLLYLIASGIMLVNGIMSHAQTVQHYNETVGDARSSQATPRTPPSVSAGDPASAVPGGRPVQTTSEETKEE